MTPHAQIANNLLFEQPNQMAFYCSLEELSMTEDHIRWLSIALLEDIALLEEPDY